MSISNSNSRKKRKAYDYSESSDKNGKVIKLSDIDHALESGDFYIGQSVHTQSPTVERFVFEPETKRMVYKSICYPKGALKLMDEALLNGADNSTRGNGTTSIRATINRKLGTIKVWNDGTNFPIEPTTYATRVVYSDTKPTKMALQPEVAFFHCKTSTAYGKKRKITGGKFGLGAKLLSIFSHWSKVSMCDGTKVFEQKSSNHMKKVHPPSIKTPKGKKKPKPFVCIEFKPDLSLFYPPEDERGRQECFDDDLFHMFLTRVYDIAGTTKKSVSVTLTTDDLPKHKIPLKNFKDYVRLFLPPDATLDNKSPASKIGYYETDRWEVCLIKNPHEGKNVSFVSFVNNVYTYRGGEHVKYIRAQVSQFLQRKVPNIDQRRVNHAVFVFINSTIEDPSFNSQSKENLQTVSNRFGSECVLPTARCLNVLLKNGVLEDLKRAMELKEMSMARKVIGASSKKSLHNIPHFVDARYAGTKQGSKCTLFIVEGASALELAEAGISVVGHKFYGAIAVKGKGVNAGKPLASVSANAEFQSICRVLGLHLGRPTLRKDLRYGKIVVLTDADLDGLHIQGLLINWFKVFWPHLLQEKAFLHTMATPIIVASKGKQPLSKRKAFYTLQVYDKWFENLSEKEQRQYKIKYYKGLGTSTAEEGRWYFKNLSTLLKAFKPATPADLEAIDLMFNGKRADNRKAWLAHCDPTDCIDYENITELSYYDLIHKGVKHFSMYAMKRSIPRVIDGLTPNQRKCTHTFLKNRITEEVKVSQVMSDVGKETKYHHAQESLGLSIVKMAQTFVGKQNVNLFHPGGQFGTRKDGGQKFAANRYIQTRLSKITRYIFRKEDDCILPVQFDEGQQIEPAHFAPIIPMILVNGAKNPAMAYACRTACHRPEDLIDCITRKLNGDDSFTFPKPWYHKFTGQIEVSDNGGSFHSMGTLHKKADRVFVIDELPVHMWRNKFRDKLAKMVEKGVLRKFFEHHYDERVKFEVHFPKTDLPAVPTAKLTALFGLKTKFSGHLNLFAGEFEKAPRVHRFASYREIFEHYFKIRFLLYTKRKEHAVRHLQVSSVPFLKAKCSFIRRVVNSTIPLGKNKVLMCAAMTQEGIPDEYHEKLMGMNIASLTKERIRSIEDELQKCYDQIEYFETVTVKTLWLKELEELRQQLVPFWKERCIVDDC
jgi:DNA topoisomerase-2